MRSRFLQAKEVSLCDKCGERVVLPPGIIFNGRRYHRGCFRFEDLRMLSVDRTSPRMNELERRLAEVLSVSTNEPL